MNLLGFFAILTIGSALILISEKFCHKSIPAWLLLGSAFPLGSITVSLYLYLLSLLKINWPQLLILIPIGISFIVSILLIKPRISKYKQINFQSVLILLSLLSLIWFFLYRIQLNHELVHSDGLNYWFLRANIFYQDQGLNLNKLSHLSFPLEVENPAGTNLPPYTFLPLQYPILVPLVIDYVYLIYGKVSVIPAKTLWLGVEWSTIILLYGIGRTTFPKKLYSGILPVLMYYLIPAVALKFGAHNFGFADTWLGLFWLMTILNIYLLITKQNKSCLPLSFIGILGILMTKMEGLVALWLIPLLIYQKPFRYRYISYILMLILLTLSLSWYLLSKDLHSGSFISLTFANLLQGQIDTSQWPNLIITFIKELANVSQYGLVWWLFFPILIYDLRKHSFSRQTWLWLIICLGLGINLIEYLVLQLQNQVDPMTIQIGLTMPRYANHWYPTVIAFLMITTVKILNNRTSK